MSAGLVAAELLNSPAKRSMGLPLTTSWVAVPRFCSLTVATILMQQTQKMLRAKILFFMRCKIGVKSLI